jgi:hypothetical protein
VSQIDKEDVEYSCTIDGTTVTTKTTVIFEGTTKYIIMTGGMMIFLNLLLLSRYPIPSKDNLKSRGNIQDQSERRISVKDSIHRKANQSPMDTG